MVTHLYEEMGDYMKRGSWYFQGGEGSTSKETRFKLDHGFHVSLFKKSDFVNLQVTMLSRIGGKTLQVNVKNVMERLVFFMSIL